MTLTQQKLNLLDETSRPFDLDGMMMEKTTLHHLSILTASKLGLKSQLPLKRQTFDLQYVQTGRLVQ